jgi:hypothetical protein
MPDRPLHRRIFAHFRGQAVGYIALFFALGGGYAIAATNSKTIHGCVVKKSGELLVKSRCAGGQQRLVWNQQGPAGPSAATAWASVNALGFTGDGARGLKVTHVSTGVYDVKLTLAKCAMVTTAPQVTVNTAISAPSYPSSWETFKSRTEFTVQTGVVTGGSFTPTDEAFNILVPCS